MEIFLSCLPATSAVDDHELPLLGVNAAASENETDFAQQLSASDAWPGEGASNIAEPAGTIGAPRSIFRIYGDDQAPVRSASPFRSPDEAARHAIGEINAQSVSEHMEYGGLIYQRPDKGTFGVTGPVTEGDADGFSFNNPLVRVPPDTNIAGAWHTHGDYSEEDPLTGAITRAPSPSRDQFKSDRFSPVDIVIQAEFALGPKGLAPEQRDAWYIEHFGAPPTSKLMHFYLGTPSGDIRRHTPSEQPPTEATEALDPFTNAIMVGYGSDVVLPRSTTG